MLLQVLGPFDDVFGELVVAVDKADKLVGFFVEPVLGLETEHHRQESRRKAETRVDSAERNMHS